MAATKVHVFGHPPRARMGRNRVVPGTYPHGWGMIAVNPRPRSSYGRDSAARSSCLDEFYRQRNLEIKFLQGVTRSIEFEEKSERRMVLSEVQRRVQLGLEAAERDVESRRNRLRELLQNDDERWQREMTIIAQGTNRNKWDQMRERAQKLRAEREREQEEVVRQKREQQWRDQCHELRTIASKEIARQTREGQLDQRRMRSALIEKERAEEKMWQAVNQKYDDARMQREEQDERRRFRLALEAAEEIDRQRRNVEASRNMDDTDNQKMKTIFVKEKIESELESKRVAEAAKAKKAQVKRDLERQMTTQRHRQSLQEEQEREQNKRIVESASKDLAKELEVKLQRKKEIKVEDLLYRQYLESVKEHRHVQDIEVENDVNEFMIKANEKELCRRKKDRDARKALQQRVLAERGGQLIEKEIEKGREREQKKADRQAAKVEAECAVLKAMEERTQRCMKNAEFRKDLDGQNSYNTLLKDRAKEASARELGEYLGAERQYSERLRAMTARPVTTQVHPFRTALQTLMAGANASGSS